jgi:uncharacterized protein
MPRECRRSPGRHPAAGHQCSRNGSARSVDVPKDLVPGFQALYIPAAAIHHGMAMIALPGVRRAQQPTVAEREMSQYPTDHAGLEILPFDECLRLLASVPVGRVGFVADGEVVVLPVNHVVDGQDVIFRTAHGSKAAASGGQDRVSFEADHYNEQTRSGWSVLVSGRAEVVDEEADIQRLSLSLSRRGVYPWVTAVRHPFWIRIRPTSVSGRQTPGTRWASRPAGKYAQPPDAVD